MSEEAATGSPRAEELEALSEMEDGPEERSRWPRVCEVLGRLSTASGSHPSLLDGFLAADRSALHFQHRRSQVAMGSAGFGLVALGIALTCLAKHYEGHAWTLAAEAVCAVFAIALVTLGLVKDYHGRWLAARHRAERLRLARYGLVIDPRTWSSDPAVRARGEAAYRDVVRGAFGVNEESMEDWAGESMPFLPPAVPQGLSGADVWREVLDYYRVRRLDPQHAYFTAAERRSRRHREWLEPLIASAFFGGVLVELLYAAIALGTRNHHASEWLLLLALLLPILAATLRIMRGAFEFGRNELRFAAVATGLERVRGRLEMIDDPVSAWQSLWTAERVLDEEHREWLRLMLEASWFG